MKAVVAAFNQEKALVGAFSVIMNLRMELFEALSPRRPCRPPAQILAHYEMALASLLATGRVRFLSQCKHVGDGVVVSLLEENVTYKVCLLVISYC